MEGAWQCLSSWEAFALGSFDLLYFGALFTVSACDYTLPLQVLGYEPLSSFPKRSKSLWDNCEAFWEMSEVAFAHTGSYPKLLFWNST